jgi:hypothetical protein
MGAGSPDPTPYLVRVARRIFSEVVGAARFELTTPCTQNRCATRLRHTPTVRCSYRPAGLRRKPLPITPRRRAMRRPPGRWPDAGSPSSRPCRTAPRDRVDLENVLRGPVAGQRGLIHRNSVFLRTHPGAGRVEIDYVERDQRVAHPEGAHAIIIEKRRACPPSVAAYPRRTSGPARVFAAYRRWTTWNRALPQSPRSSTRDPRRRRRPRREYRQKGGRSPSGPRTPEPAP